MKHKYFPALDGLRCLAIVVVMFSHAGVRFVRSGGIGVDIFFVLSGFLITSILLAEHIRFGSISFFNFYLRRFLRLLPALLLVACYVAVELRIATGQWPLKGLAIAVTYWMNWAKVMTGNRHFPLGHTWSLAIEEQFYLVWPLVVTLVCLGIRSQRARVKFFVGLALAVAIYRLLMVYHYSAARIYLGSDTHSDGLIMGAALAFFVTLLDDGRLPERWSCLLGKILAPGSLLALGAIMLSIHWWNSSMGRFGYFFVALGSSALVLDLVAGSHSLLLPLFSLRPMIWIGKISYSLYLWHLPIFHTMEHLHVRGGGLLKLAIGAPLSVAAAAASYYLIEKRFLKLKDRFVRAPLAPVVRPIEAPEELEGLSVTT